MLWMDHSNSSTVLRYICDLPTLFCFSYFLFHFFIICRVMIITLSDVLVNIQEQFQKLCWSLFSEYVLDLKKVLKYDSTVCPDWSLIGCCWLSWVVCGSCSSQSCWMAAEHITVMGRKESDEPGSCSGVCASLNVFLSSSNIWSVFVFLLCFLLAAQEPWTPFINLRAN